VALVIAIVPLVLAARSARAQTYKVLYSFTVGGLDGSNPYAGLVRDTNGNLYGTTYSGGPILGGGCCRGVVFEVGAGGGEVVLAQLFRTPNGRSKSLRRLTPG
jgi:hypothetical protein